MKATAEDTGGTAELCGDGAAAGSGARWCGMRRVMVVWAAVRGGAGSDGGLCGDGEGAAVIGLRCGCRGVFVFCFFSGVNRGTLREERNP